MRPLDAIDATILVELQRDGRISNKALAEVVGLAPSSCLERVRRLREDGVLRRTVADLHASAVGVGLQALASVDLLGIDPAARRALIEGLATLQEVVQVFEIGGPSDLVLHLACRDAAHLGELLDRQIRPAVGVERVNAAIILRHASSEVPIYR